MDMLADNKRGGQAEISFGIERAMTSLERGDVIFAFQRQIRKLSSKHGPTGEIPGTLLTV